MEVAGSLKRKVGAWWGGEAGGGEEWKKKKLRNCKVEILKVRKRLEKEEMNLYNPSKNSVS